MNSQENIYDVLIVGAGPAGLTAGYLLSKKNYKILIVEENKKYVGGISRTEEYKGFKFDIGGHRFFSKSEEINKLWDEILDEDFLIRDRQSRIFYKNKFYNYPLKIKEVLINLGFVESSLCILSYLKSCFLKKKAKSYHDWIYNNFGERLFNNFFKTYTEKVWGMSCDEISADWASQRIKGLNLWKLIFNTVLKIIPFQFNKKKIIKTLIDKFKYPKYGPGMMWDSAAKKIKSYGNMIMLDCKATKFSFDKKKQIWTTECIINENNEKINISSKHIISSAPLRESIPNILPKLKITSKVLNLRYRDFITVALLLKKKPIFLDNWIYIHDPSVKVGRVQNFNSWSEYMTPNKEMGCLGMEYFCNENDSFWKMQDSQLKEVAIKEITELKLSNSSEIFDAFVVRQKKAYPVYDSNYNQIIKELSDEIKNHYTSFHPVGRNGLHKYNNQDHAMMTAILTVKNIIAKNQVFDVWNVNEDAEYHEEINDSNLALKSLRMVPKKID